MNQLVQETLWKIICGSVLAVWTYLLFKFGQWFSDRWFRGIKITARWTDKVENGWRFDFTAYLFLEPSQHDKSDREVIGLLYYKLMATPDAEFLLRRPLHSTCYEIVKGTLTELDANDKMASMTLHHLGVTDKLLISPAMYTIKLTDKRTKCEGTTTDTQSGQVNGWLFGAVITGAV